MLGKAAVGKTSIINRYLNNICPEEYEPSVEETYTMQIKTEKGEERDFKIVDTPGEETDQNLLDEWICNSNCIILVYAINEENSFEGLKEYYERIKQNKTEKISIILVGNKSDLDIDRKISKQNAETYAKSIGASYFETSALKDENGNCKNVFQECANKIIKNANDEVGGDSKCVKCSIF